MDIVTKLLYAGADPNLHSFTNTPLSLAIQNGHHDYVNILLAHRADMNILISHYLTEQLVNPVLNALIKTNSY